MHTAYVPWADRGLVITTAESYHSDCFEPFHPNYVIDVSDFDNPRKVAEFGRWSAPPDAPYDDFCDARGRMGTSRMMRPITACGVNTATENRLLRCTGDLMCP